MINSTQCKMARVALGWSAANLAQAAEVGVATVNRFEAGTGAPIPATLAAIQRALEAAGVEFIPENGGGAGVRLRKGGAPHAPTTNAPRLRSVGPEDEEDRADPEAPED